MQAIQGTYDDGVFSLDRQAPVKKAKIIVLFADDEFVNEKKMSTKEALQILEKYKGSIRGDFDAENERDEYFYEKHGIID